MGHLILRPDLMPQHDLGILITSTLSKYIRDNTFISFRTLTYLATHWKFTCKCCSSLFSNKITPNKNTRETLNVPNNLD